VKTPCQVDPEMWLSEVMSERAEAARACLSCPAFDWCKAEAMKIKPDHGVWAGRDYSKRSATGDLTKCARPGCDGEFQQASVGAQRRYCGPRCRYLASGPRPIEHGTEGGARTHYRRGEKPCADCAAAQLRAGRERDRRAS
jgi:hypothetical protein